MTMSNSIISEPGAVPKAPDHKGISKEPVHQSISKEPDHQSISKEPDHQSISKEPIHQSISKEPVHQSISKEPNHQSISKEPVHQSMSKAPFHDSITQGQDGYHAAVPSDHKRTSKRPAVMPRDEDTDVYQAIEELIDRTKPLYEVPKPPSGGPLYTNTEYGLDPQRARSQPILPRSDHAAKAVRTLQNLNDDQLGEDIAQDDIFVLLLIFLPVLIVLLVSILKYICQIRWALAGSERKMDSNVGEELTVVSS